ncbi:MAG: efflux RND transporter permease subunit [Planctomycetota bacterium]
MISFFARHPTAANLLMFAFLAVGLLSIGSLRRETFPDFDSSELEIRVVYPGATAEEVEEGICQRVEDALDGVKFVLEMRSEAREGVGTVTIEMEEAGDFPSFKDEVDSAIASIDTFPDDAEEAVITQLNTTDLVIALLVSGGMSPSDLKAHCEDLKLRLQRVKEISLVEVKGFSDHQLRVELSSDALRRYNLSVADVAGIIGRQSVDLPSGSIQTREQDLLIRFVEQRRSTDELEDLIIFGSEGGTDVRLRDLGRVIDRFERNEEKVQVGGRRAGLLHVRKTSNQDTIRVADAVKAFVEEERLRQPNVEILITQDGSTLVNDRLKMLVKNGLQGMLLVFLAMWTFFNIRLSFWVVMSLPVSFLGAFFFLPHLDLTINMMTMVGMLLALGLLMDDGIVIAENIASHRERGKSGMQAAIDGVSEVAAGVFSSFVTTIFVLGPLGFLSGDIGKVLKVIPIILIVVMAVSLVEAFCILPAHLGHALHHQRDPGKARRRFESLIEFLRENVVGRSVDFLLRWRYLWVGSVIATLLFSLGLWTAGVVRFQAFPELDGDVVVARILLPQGTPLERTDAVVAEVTSGLNRVNDRFADRQPEGRDLIQTTYVQFNQNTDAFEEGPHVATIYANLLGAEIRDAPLDEVLDAWRSEVGRQADTLSLTYNEPSFGPSGRPIEIRIQGDELAELKAVASDFIQELSNYRGVNNLSDDLRTGKREVRLRMRGGTAGLNLDAATLSSQLRSAFQGEVVDDIQVRGEAYEIDVRLSELNRDSLDDLSSFRVLLPDGKQVPLETVAEVEMGRGWSRISRVNGRRTVTIRGDVDTRFANTAAILKHFERDFLADYIKSNPSIQVSLEGESAESATTTASMARAMLIGVLGVYFLLSFQFRSYVEPLIVMTAIPFALVGVILGHLLLGLDLSMPSLLGFVSLSGIVVNDSILLVLFIKRARKEGEDLQRAAAQASRQRFRAIVITSLTTIAGLLPLLAEQSLQAQVLIPLAVSIAFGLMSSTVLVLLVIPCLYVILTELRMSRD